MGTFYRLVPVRVNKRGFSPRFLKCLSFSLNRLSSVSERKRTDERFCLGRSQVHTRDKHGRRAVTLTTAAAGRTGGERIKNKNKKSSRRPIVRRDLPALSPASVFVPLHTIERRRRRARTIPPTPPRTHSTNVRCDGKRTVENENDYGARLVGFNSRRLFNDDRFLTVIAVFRRDKNSLFSLFSFLFSSKLNHATIPASSSNTRGT